MYVFTDPTCGYCAKLEREVDSSRESGVKVHYIPFPRAGVSDTENPAFKTWAVAMCDEAPAVAYRSYTTRQKDMPVDASYTEDCADKIKEGYGMAKTLVRQDAVYLLSGCWWQHSDQRGIFGGHYAA